nr:hypothetical protein [Tanacetum cinerariifolium]
LRASVERMLAVWWSEGRLEVRRGTGADNELRCSEEIARTGAEIWLGMHVPLLAWTPRD